MHKIILRYLVQFGFENPIEQANLSISTDGNVILYNLYSIMLQNKIFCWHACTRKLACAILFRLNRETDKSTIMGETNSLVKTSSLPTFHHAQTSLSSHQDGHMIDEHTTVELPLLQLPAYLISKKQKTNQQNKTPL